MKLSDKILYCRKRSGLSQEALAEKLNVSRQAVSKWETGEALPDLNNIVIIANEFGVSTDWLLKEDMEEPEATVKEDPKLTPQPPRQPQRSPKRTFMKYAWILALIVALLGIPVTVEGIVMTYIGGNVANIGETFTQSVNVYDEFGNAVNDLEDVFGQSMGFGQYGDVFSDTASTVTATANGIVGIFSLIGILIIVIGLIMTVGGTVAAIVLKKKAKNITV